jgi:hypothetical protein
MRSILKVAPLLVLGACAGNQTLYSTAAEGSRENAMRCAAAAIADEGFRITSRNDDAGLLNAVHEGTTDDAGEHWIQMTIVPEEASNFFRVDVRTGDSEIARDAAAEIRTECGWGR